MLKREIVNHSSLLKVIGLEKTIYYNYCFVICDCEILLIDAKQSHITNQKSILILFPIIYI